MYEEDAVVHALPMGSYAGRSQIKALYTKLINEGYGRVEYINPVINIEGEWAATLSARWRMNKAEGVIYKERWVIQPDGRALLREDVFEASSKR